MLSNAINNLPIKWRLYYVSDALTNKKTKKTINKFQLQNNCHSMVGVENMECKNNFVYFVDFHF